MFQSILLSYRHALRLWVPLLASHVFVRLVATAVLLPLIGALLAITLSFSDQSALTDQDIARFLLTPVGAIGALILGAFVIIAAVVDVAFMTAVIRAEQATVAKSLRIATGFLIGVLPRLFAFAIELLVRVLLISLPFLAIGGGAAALLLTEFDINYYLANRPPAFQLTVAIGGVCAVALILVLLERLSGWAIALHLALFDNERPIQAFAISRKKMKGHRWALLRELVYWALLRLVLATVVLGAMGFLIAEVPQLFGGNMRIFFTVMAVLIVLWIFANGFVNAVSNGALSNILNDEFDRTLEARPTFADLKSRTPIAQIVSVPVAIGVISVVGVLLGTVAFNQVGGPEKVDVIGHRGAAASRPENTMAAVEKAIEDGADWVEIDVQETADGQVIVVHDSDFMKSASVPLKVWDATMKDIAEIDIGSWFDPVYAGQRAPLLRDVLNVVKDRSKLIIELKYYGHDVDLENRVIALVEEAGMEQQIATMSLKYPAVQKMLQLRPDWRTGVLAATSVGDLTGLDGDFVAVSAASLSSRLIRRAESAGKDVYVWTVNDAALMSRMISLGVAGLITDEPALAREVVAYHQTLSTAERFLLRLGDSIGFAFDLTPPVKDEI